MLFEPFVLFVANFSVFFFTLRLVANSLVTSFSLSRCSVVVTKIACERQEARRVFPPGFFIQNRCGDVNGRLRGLPSYSGIFMVRNRLCLFPPDEKSGVSALFEFAHGRLEIDHGTDVPFEIPLADLEDDVSPLKAGLSRRGFPAATSVTRMPSIPTSRSPSSLPFQG